MAYIVLYLKVKVLNSDIGNGRHQFEEMVKMQPSEINKTLWCHACHQEIRCHHINELHVVTRNLAAYIHMSRYLYC